jgi:hypothetical protein
MQKSFKLWMRFYLDYRVDLGTEFGWSEKREKRERGK